MTIFGSWAPSLTDAYLSLWLTKFLIYTLLMTMLPKVISSTLYTLNTNLRLREDSPSLKKEKYVTRQGEHFFIQTCFPGMKQPSRWNGRCNIHKFVQKWKGHCIAYLFSLINMLFRILILVLNYVIIIIIYNKFPLIYLNIQSQLWYCLYISF